MKEEKTTTRRWRQHRWVWLRRLVESSFPVVASFSLRFAHTNSHALPHCRRLQSAQSCTHCSERCVASSSDCAIVKLRLRRNFLALPRPRLANPCESVAREREARWVARCFSTPIRRPLRPPSPPAPPSVIAMSLRPETHTTSILRPSNSCHPIVVTKSASGF